MTEQTRPTQVLVEETALRRLIERTALHPDPTISSAARAVIAATSKSARRAWLSPAEYAAATGLSRRTVARRLADGSLDHERLGRRVLIPADAVRGARSSQEVPGGANRWTAAIPAGHRHDTASQEQP